MRKIIGLFLVLVLISCGENITTKKYESPDLRYPELFEAVQNSLLFENDRVFANAIPKIPAEELEQLYLSERKKPGFSLKIFVNEFFEIKMPSGKANLNNSLDDYLKAFYTQNLRKPKDDKGSLVPTRGPYISAGEMLEEFYYPTDYFMMLGLKAQGKESQLKDCIVNYLQFVQDYGGVPVGNRTYLLNRFPAPYIPLMIDLLGVQRNEFLTESTSLLTKEYQNWMAALDKEMVKAQNEAKNAKKLDFKQVVFLENDQVLNKYYYDGPEKARPEFYNFDKRKLGSKKDFFTELILTDLSGGNTRWSLLNSNDTESINNILPVDLNALLYYYEKTLSEAYKIKGESIYAKSFEKLAKKRKDTFNKYFWNEEVGFYFDYNYKTHSGSNKANLAGFYALYVGIASKEQSKKMADFTEKYFLEKHGLSSTFNLKTQLKNNLSSAENHLVAIEGLKKYGFDVLSNQIRNRFTACVSANYNVSHLLQEQYDVKNITSIITGDYQKISGTVGVLLYYKNH